MTAATEQMRSGPPRERIERRGDWPDRRASDRTRHQVKGWMVEGENRPERQARALGWFSIGLGLAQVGAPRTVARLIGVEDEDGNWKTITAIGFREIATGIGILAQPHSPGWLWARFGGDLIDLALLSSALRSDGDTRRTAMAGTAVLGATVLDFMTARRLSQPNGAPAPRRRAADRGTHVLVGITVNRPRNEVYEFWRNFENLPRFMEHLESVRTIDDRRSHWKARAPAGSSVEWDAEIIEDRPNELITWHSLPQADVPNTGTVRFKDAPGNRGTEVTVELRYQPPGGKLGTVVSKLFGEEPEQQVKSDLRRFKQVMEIGEVVHSDASIHRGPHPAQPSRR